MIRQCTVRAPAKINLSLDITGAREDGYHLIESVMQTIGIFDIIRISADIRNHTSDLPDTVISITGDSTKMPTDSSNTAFKAARFFLRELSLMDSAEKSYLHRIDIHISKNIPQEAGLAGGSADAAGTLYGLNFLMGDVIKRDTLAEIAAATGADVPFCLAGGTCICKGIGELITPVKDIGSYDVVLFKPEYGMSTAMAYKAVDEAEDTMHPDTQGVLNAIDAGDVRGVMKAGGNIFEGPVFRRYPELADITALLRNMDGSLGAAMSGSGTAVFGIFGDSAAASEASEILKERADGPGRYIFTVKTFTGGPELVTADQK